MAMKNRQELTDLISRTIAVCLFASVIGVIVAIATRCLDGSSIFG